MSTQKGKVKPRQTRIIRIGGKKYRLCDGNPFGDCKGCILDDIVRLCAFEEV